MKPEDISRKANEERERQKKKSFLSMLNREEKPVFKPKSPDGWYVYSRIYPYYYNWFLWIYIIMTLGVVFLALYYLNSSGEWSFYAGLVFLGLYLIRYFSHLTLKIYRFSSYKRWRSTLPFALRGWDKIGSFKDFPKGHHWNYYCSLKVELRNNTNAEAQKLVKDALFIFCSEANKAFYEAGPGMDGRDKWVEDSTDKLKVKGSANSAVIGDMYICIDQHLRAIHLKHNNIAAVEAGFGDTVTEIDPPSTD